MKIDSYSSLVYKTNLTKSVFANELLRQAFAIGSKSSVYENKFENKLVF